jgi:hypothetical protein
MMMMLWRRFVWELTLLPCPQGRKLTLLGHLKMKRQHLRLVVEIASE